MTSLSPISLQTLNGCIAASFSLVNVIHQFTFILEILVWFKQKNPLFFINFHNQWMKSQYSNFFSSPKFWHIYQNWFLKYNISTQKDYELSGASDSASHIMYVTGVRLGNNNACRRCLHWQCVDAVITLNMSLK